MIVRGGLVEASLSTVAKEAGVSVGLIQRYFTTKAELLEFALLTSVVDGLCLDMVTSPAEVTPELARACLRRAVERAFGGAA